MFGYEKGAFTGANSQRVGLIETAEGGTLFLDEIGDIPLPVQVKILRFLQEKTIQRVGGRREIEVNCRVLSATHVDLGKAIETGHFREDLYFRLAVVACKLPPLRERGDDILLLAHDFLKRFAAQNRRDSLVFDEQAARAIARHPWSGNVRELQNRIQRAVIMADGKWITIADLELGLHSARDGGGDISGSNQTCATTVKGGLREARERFEREMVVVAMERHDGNISAASKELGISRPTFYELMTKLGVSKDS